MSLGPVLRGTANGLLLGLNTLVGFTLMVLPAGAVVVDVRQRAIPAPLRTAHADPAWRQGVRDWIHVQWSEKDRRIAALLKGGPSRVVART
ncbi:hypothetical protein QTI33_31520 [Variovorax sp. J22P271]|uniref:hypothetical protein n=1 Tax=Variovorax davisae TaxID=3053515 RepID=UPI00257908D1|nr:hypothetical protein [Variovorax sp. J22P271]MDM0036702.1 hypothetical protein [Variovorax sp. J22P271]